MKEPVRVTITGAAGQIGYALLFRVASGAMLGPDQPVILQLLEITPALGALKGVVMELDDCAFPLLAGTVETDDANVAFKDTDYALLVGSRPRGPGMERKDLLEANAAIFSVQGKALNDHASKTVKTLVVGNPANTNCLIAQRNAPDLDPRNFTAMTRLDHNRAMAQIAAKVGKHVSEVQGLCIWGNHSATQYPDLHRTTVDGDSAMDAVDMEWYENDFIPTVQQRGAAIIEARGSSSAASAANAAVDHMRDWALGLHDFVRYSDLDTYDHVNNKIYHTWFENLRIIYLIKSGFDFTNKKNAMPVVRTSSIEYNSAMFLDEEYTTVIRCSKVGKTSFDLDYEVHSALEVKAKGQTKIVMADLVAGKSVALDNSFRELFITRDLALNK